MRDEEECGQRENQVWAGKGNPVKLSRLVAGL